MLAEKRPSAPTAFARPELAILTQLLRAPYAAIKVAHVAREDMEPRRAREVLLRMKSALEAGRTWRDVYRKFSDQYPDVRKRAANPQNVGTLIGYLYGGIVSPGGFDISAYTLAASLPAEHLRALFRFRQRARVLPTASGVYLYYVERYYDGAGSVPGDERRAKHVRR